MHSPERLTLSNPLIERSRKLLDDWAFKQTSRPPTFWRFVLVARAMMIVLHGRGTPAQFFEFSAPTYHQILEALEPNIPYSVLHCAFGQIQEWFLVNLVHNYQTPWGETRVTMDEFWDEIADACFPIHAPEAPEPEYLKLARMGVMLGEHLVHQDSLCPGHIYECATVVQLLVMKMRESDRWRGPGGARGVR
ncbi:hypothetical protein FRC09_008383 [Ceratobasidium sp. 395]|nr:hypothetical protein FRC09_008383 [Ceratobasidium sp. 395]